jgi:hypothetical protein
VTPTAQEAGHAAKIIQDAPEIGIVNYCSKLWPTDREQHRAIISDQLRTA